MGAGVPGRKEQAALGPMNQDSYWSLFSYPKRVYLPVQEPLEGVGCELLSHDQEALAGVDPASGAALGWPAVEGVPFPREMGCGWRWSHCWEGHR